MGKHERKNSVCGRDWRLPGLLHVAILILCDESEEDLRVMAGQFAEVRRRRGLKVNAGKSKLMVLNGEKRLEQGWGTCGLLWSVEQNV